RRRAAAADRAAHRASDPGGAGRGTDPAAWRRDRARRPRPARVNAHERRPQGGYAEMARENATRLARQESTAADAGGREAARASGPADRKGGSPHPQSEALGSHF